MLDVLQCLAGLRCHVCYDLSPQISGQPGNSPLTQQLRVQAVRPQAISDMVLAAESMRFPADSKQMQAKPGSCGRCGYISSQPVCKVGPQACAAVCLLTCKLGTRLASSTGRPVWPV